MDYKLLLHSLLLFVTFLQRKSFKVSQLLVDPKVPETIRWITNSSAIGHPKLFATFSDFAGVPGFIGYVRIGLDGGC